MLGKSLIKRYLFLITVPLFLACPHRQRPPPSPLHPALNLQTPEPKTKVGRSLLAPIRIGAQTQNSCAEYSKSSTGRAHRLGAPIESLNRSGLNALSADGDHRPTTRFARERVPQLLDPLYNFSGFSKSSATRARSRPAAPPSITR